MVAIVFALFLLSGCLSLSQEEKTSAMQGPVSLEKSMENSVHHTTVQIGELPKEKWWEDFQEPSLSLLIEQALLENPSLEAIRARIHAAQYQARIRRSKLMPTLFFDADDNWRYLSEHGFTHLLNEALPLKGYEVNLSLAFSYELDFFSKYRNLFRSSLGELRAEEAELAQSKLILSSSLAQSCFALWIDEQKKTLYENLYQVRSQVLSLQNTLSQNALSSKLSPLFLEENLQAAGQLLQEIEGEIAHKRHLINMLRGKGPDEELPLFTHCKLPTISLPQTLSLDLLSRRPDIAAQLWRVEALACQVSAARADFFPNINLSAFAGLVSIAFSNLLSFGSKTTGAEPAISLPLFTGGAIRAQAKKQYALFQEAVQSYNDLVLRAAQEVTDVLTYLQVAQINNNLQIQSVQNAKERLSLTSLRKQEGLDSAFTLLALQEECIWQELKALSLRYDTYAFTVRLIQSIGGGYTP